MQLVPITNMLWVRTPLRRCVLDIVCDKICQWLAAGWWVSPVSSTNKTDLHDIIELLLKVALNTVKLLKQPLIKLLNGSKKVHHNHSSHGIVIFYDISRAQWVGLPNKSYNPITNTVWVRARLCKLQKRVHSTRSRKW
jgi:hypothetical protein